MGWPSVIARRSVYFICGNFRIVKLPPMLDIPIGTVMSRVSRGKAELRRRLGEITAEAARKVVPPHEGPRDG
jgi:hypothetical protein